MANSVDPDQTAQSSPPTVKTDIHVDDSSRSGLTRVNAVFMIVPDFRVTPNP